MKGTTCLGVFKTIKPLFISIHSLMEMILINFIMFITPTNGNMMATFGMY